jgi:GrpB-like predicted nucleotidyltransferase (UPF0157 family)
VAADSIQIVEYEQQWPGMFAAEREFLLSIVGKYVCGTIEHVGSTAVRGLSAKPIVDIMLGVQSLAGSKGAITLLVAKGYCYYPYKVDVMHWFCKPTPEIRTHHLHLVPFQSDLWFERLAFRDCLRKNVDLATEYASLKHKLARQFKDERERYTQGKGPFIQDVLASLAGKTLIP